MQKDFYDELKSKDGLKKKYNSKKSKRNSKRKQEFDIRPKNFKCYICNTLFENETDYILHIETLHEGRNREYAVCNQCGRKFKSKSQLAAHLISKCGTVRCFKCDECEKSYMTQGALYHHKLRHADKRAYMCRFCAERFFTNGQLDVHERRHTKEKVFICEVCNKGFAHRQTLITHSSIHTGIKPFLCQGCNKSFSCVGNLLKHRKTHATTCGSLPLTNHRIHDEETRQKLHANTPSNVKLREKRKKEKIQSILKSHVTNLVEQSLEQAKNLYKTQENNKTGTNEHSEKLNSKKSLKNGKQFKKNILKIKKISTEPEHIVTAEKKVLVNSFKKDSDIFLNNEQTSSEIKVEKYETPIFTADNIVQNIISIKSEDNQMGFDDSKHFINENTSEDNFKIKANENEKLRDYFSTKNENSTSQSSEYITSDFDYSKLRRHSLKHEDPYDSLGNDAKNISSFHNKNDSIKVEFEIDNDVNSKLKENYDSAENENYDSKSLINFDVKEELNSIDGEWPLDIEFDVANSDNNSSISDYSVDLYTRCLKYRKRRRKTRKKSTESIKCKYCNQSYSKTGWLTRHEKWHQQNGDNFSKYKCYCCKETFETNEERLRHQREKHKEELGCNICKKIFCTPDSQKNHFRHYHLGVPRKEYFYICDMCGKSLRSKICLENHKKSQCGKENYFKCEECGKTFCSIYSRREHYKLHIKPKSFLCKYCGKKFSRKGEVQVHERSHTGEKPYKCEFCPKSFAYRESLITHNSLHTGIKPHLCTNCGSRFSCVGNLIKHRRTHASTCGQSHGGTEGGPQNLFYPKRDHVNMRGTKLKKKRSDSNNITVI